MAVQHIMAELCMVVRHKMVELYMNELFTVVEDIMVGIFIHGGGALHGGSYGGGEMSGWLSKEGSTHHPRVVVLSMVWYGMVLVRLSSQI